MLFVWPLVARVHGSCPFGELEFRTSGVCHIIHSFAVLMALKVEHGGWNVLVNQRTWLTGSFTCSPALLQTCSTPFFRCSLCLHPSCLRVLPERADHLPALRTLQWLFPLPGMSFPKTLQQWSPHPSVLSSVVTFSERPLLTNLSFFILISPPFSALVTLGNYFIPFSSVSLAGI